MFSQIKKHALFLVLPLVLSGVMPVRVNAWGPSGHRIVALVATRHLTPEARRAVRNLLGDETLADVADWADAIREERPETGNWHFANLPRNAASFNRSRDCRDAANGDPGCVVTAIEKYRSVLSNARASKADRAEALKFIVHFIGDMHQPLHVSFKEDKGGNDIKVTFFGKQSNLHKVWDSGIIGRAGLSDLEFAAELEAVLHSQSGDEEFAEMDESTKRKIATIQGGTLDSFASESFVLAKSNAYDSVSRDGKARLGARYYEVALRPGLQPNWQVVDDQLTKAGLRLAKILNEALR